MNGGFSPEQPRRAYAWAMIKPLFRALAGTALAITAGAPAAPPIAQSWEIGPVIRGRNYSVDTPASPAIARGGGMIVAMPRAPGSVHYVTMPSGSLAGAHRIVMRYRVELAPGAAIRPITAPASPSIITLYFQRGGDDWSARGRFESYRWYATFASQSPIVAGKHTLVAPLTGNWTAVQSSSARSNPAGFAAALATADRIGFVLGGGDGYGHGVFATGPARIVVTDFRVE